MEFSHISVLLQESVSYLNVKPDGIYADGTLGGGGHSALICSRLSKDGMLLGIDRDKTALRAAKERLDAFPCKKQFCHRNFFEIESILQEMNIPQLDGAILDLGVSSPQLDCAERGFSYHQTARLDMRMDQRNALSAYEVVNDYSEENLSRILHEYGEERFARKIAHNICVSRRKSVVLPVPLAPMMPIRSPRSTPAFTYAVPRVRRSSCLSFEVPTT